VVATTSSADKANRLKALGADHVLNYRDETNWGKAARALTQVGFHHVIDVGGTSTLRQSLEAVAIKGVISIVGFPLDIL
jgi:NADPH:quinone reductase-like Zn-dependent oxidoreductase